MKGYKTILQEALQKLGGHANQLYSRYASLGRDLLLRLYNTPENRDPYYNRRKRREMPFYDDLILFGTGYPELRPVGSYI